MDDHRITDREPLDPRPDLMDPAGRLVAHHEWWRQAQVGEHAVEDVEISPAKPGASDPDDDIEWAGYVGSGTSSMTGSSPNACSRTAFTVGSDRRKGSDSRVSDRLILIDAAAADPDRPDHYLVSDQGYAAGERHEPAACRIGEAEERSTWLNEVGKHRRWGSERGSGEGLVGRDVERPESRRIHSGLRPNVAAVVDHGDGDVGTELTGVLQRGLGDERCGRARASSCVMSLNERPILVFRRTISAVQGAVMVKSD